MTWIKSITDKLETTLPVILLQRLVKFRWILLLAVLVWANAITVAYITHKNRSHTALLEHLKHEQYQLEMEWEALRLEQGTLAEHNRIENMAKQKLAMKNVAATDEVLIEQD